MDKASVGSNSSNSQESALDRRKSLSVLQHRANTLKQQIRREMEAGKDPDANSVREYYKVRLTLAASHTISEVNAFIGAPPEFLEELLGEIGSPEKDAASPAPSSSYETKARAHAERLLDIATKFMDRKMVGEGADFISVCESLEKMHSLALSAKSLANL